MRFLQAIILIFATLCVSSARANEPVYFTKAAKNEFASKRLQAMAEPSLLEHGEDAALERYRFLWLRTFHPAIAVRIQKDASGIHLRVVRLAGKSGYEVGRVDLDKTVTIDAVEWETFLLLLERKSFFKLETTKENIDVRDGSTWILEAQVGDSYHRVDRFSPPYGKSSETDRYVRSARYLLRLGMLEIPTEDIY